jgi:hypothetical protein
MADDIVVPPEGSESSRASTPNAQSQKWLRRFSTSISKSRDSSRTPSSRPASAMISHSNGSLAFSHSGSTTPMLPNIESTAQPRNRLVKRSSSVRGVSDSPSQNPGSRLPVPTFKRPATSHQRSATLHERPSAPLFHARMFSSDVSGDARDPHWRHYFTPKVARVDDTSSLRRPSISGIPNPIKRIYPDRRYTPTLVSAQQYIRQGDVEADDELSLYDVSEAVTPATMPTSAASSPLLSQNESTFASKRSFSFGNILSAGPSTLSRRSSLSKSRTTTDTLSRSSTGRRLVSAPQSSMGTSLSSSRKTSERLSKRRNVSNAEPISHATHGISANPSEEIQVNLSDEGPAQLTPTSDTFDLNTESDGTQQDSTEQRRMPSATTASGAKRHSRLSAATSEFTSNFESDSENRSLGDTSTDYQSDAFDSFPTRTTTTTRSSSGKRGPPIETIFDESPPTFSSGRSTKLRDFLSTGNFPASDPADKYRYSTIEEEDNIATPRRSLADKSLQASPTARHGSYNAFTSSPPALREIADPDDIDWDTPDEAELASSPPETARRVSRSPGFPTYQIETSLPLRLAPPSRSHHSGSTLSTPRRNGASQDRATIFDWAEMQPSPSHNNSPPRPKTVHGKKDPEHRGSRPPGRRLPSGMHARSHSVPVVPDVDGKRTSAVATKFGTWGVGSKGVTEDWNEDFDFEDPLPELPAFIEDRRVDSGHAMFIPKSIQEQQQNVVANIGLLREWGLLIEELKELRIRAAALGMLAGPHASAWSEVEAMIDLADQESHEATLEPRLSPPSSPGFDDFDFEEPMHEPVQSARARARSIRTPQPPMLADEDDVAVFSEPQTPSRSILTRPRKDSEAVARSVIEALQTKRTVSDPTSLQAQKPVKKVPFDTATLRHIVPYVNGVKRKIKEALREAEGLYTSPARQITSEDDEDDDFDFSDDEPSFRTIFTDPRSEGTPEARPSRRNMAITDNDESEEGNVFGAFG